MECYDIFADRLDPILRNIQGSNRHIGRKSRSLDKSIVKNMEEKQKKLNKLQAERDDYRKQVVADFQKT